MQSDDIHQELKDELLSELKPLVQQFFTVSERTSSNQVIGIISHGAIKQFVSCGHKNAVSDSYYVRERVGGLGGGISRSPRNVLVNWKELFITGGESVFTIIAAVSSSWIIPAPFGLTLAGLIILRKLYSLSTINLTERHAAVLWAMWIHKDLEFHIKTNLLGNLVNMELSNYHRPPMSDEELRLMINDLERIGCIESEDGEWLFRETMYIQ
jgi:hypothetical protein